MKVGLVREAGRGNQPRPHALLMLPGQVDSYTWAGYTGADRLPVI